MPMFPCLSQLTTLPQSFGEDVDLASDIGCPSLEVWLTKLEQHLEGHTLAETRHLIQDRGIRLVAAAGQGGLFHRDETARRSHWELFRRRLELCQALNIPLMIVSLDLPTPWQRSDWSGFCEQLQRAADWADAFQVRLALEFQADSPFCNCLDTALSVLASFPARNLGLCLDWFHFFKGPSKTEDLLRLPPHQLHHVQICDVAGLPRELWSDSDRILPGEGDLPLTSLFQHLQRLNYAGAISVEVTNPELWRGPPAQLMRLAWLALARCWQMSGLPPWETPAQSSYSPEFPPFPH
ncbi:MAG: sugar phosphate isomerase/epimerase [Thermogemmata sp.]